MSDWAGFWVAVAMLMIAFGAADCQHGTSIAQAVVTRLSK
jgi:hypothetical protein